MGSYPRSASGEAFLRVVNDLFTRRVKAFPIASSKPPTITAILEIEAFILWGHSRQILSDNSKQFANRYWLTACQRWDCELRTTSIYHPRANPIERRNQEIKRGIRLRVDTRDIKTWGKNIPEIMFSIRRRQNAATGQTPSHLLLGWTIHRSKGRFRLMPNRSTFDYTKVCRKFELSQWKWYICENIRY